LYDQNWDIKINNFDGYNNLVNNLEKTQKAKKELKNIKLAPKDIIGQFTNNSGGLTSEGSKLNSWIKTFDSWFNYNDKDDLEKELISVHEVKVDKVWEIKFDFSQDYLKIILKFGLNSTLVCFC
jgi:hypothetical protein